MTNGQRDNLGVLALVPDDWSVAWQRRHQVLTRLAARVPVAWISPPRHWRDRLTGQPRKTSVYPAPDPRMFVLSSASGMPAVNRPELLYRAILRRRAEQGATWLRDRGCSLVELQIWFPAFAVALDWHLHTSSSYHIDDEYSWSPVDQPMSDAERSLIRRVDRLFVTSPKLLDTKGGINAHTVLSPNGVDFNTFSTPCREPDDLAHIPHPRIGYVGVLKEQLDWELIAGLAAKNTYWSFVFVGPVRAVHASVGPALSLLSQLPNVYMIGERDPRDLPAYVQHMDVSLLPYRRNDYTDAINPVKLYESLAAGVPIVASRIRTVVGFAHVVTIAHGVNGWTLGIADALAGETALRKSARQAVARDFDWDIIAASLLPATVSNSR